MSSRVVRTASLLALMCAAVASIVVVLPAVSSADGTGEISGTLSGNRRYRRNAIVYVDRAPGRHQAPRRPVTMDQRNHKFLPAVLPVVAGTTVRFLNNDPEAHNVFSPDGEGYDLGNWTNGQHREHTFSRAGVYTQLCRLHPSMIGYVVVLQNPYFAPVRRDGSFRIRNVPPGRYQLKVWQERGAGGPTNVQVRADQTAEVEIEVARRRR